MVKNKPLQGKEAFMRMNFLYQAAHTLMATIPNSEHLVSHFGKCMVKIGKKNVLRLDQDLKRNICKGCGNILAPGVSSTVRSRRKKGRKRVIITCLLCSSVKRFPINRKLPRDRNGKSTSK